jgi:hypothetical protein
MGKWGAGKIIDLDLVISFKMYLEQNRVLATHTP